MRSSVLSGVSALVALSTVLAAPASAQYGTNLIVNGGAEQVLVGGSCQTAAGINNRVNGNIIRPCGWTVTAGSFTAVTWNSAGSPALPTYATPAPGGAAERGTNFFAGGQNSNGLTNAAARSSAFQTILLPNSIFANIDLGHVDFTLSGWLGGYLNQVDAAALTVQFLDAGAAPIGATVALAAVTPGDRGNLTGFLARTTLGEVPIGTRSATVTLTMTRGTATFTDGYADNLAFSLTNSAPPVSAVPEPGTVALMATGLLGLAGVARRRRR